MGKTSHSKKKHSMAKFNHFSVVIPTRNRSHTLKKTLHSLSQVDYPRDHFEIIVVDNAPDDETSQRICSFFQKKLNNLIYQRIPIRGTSAARNKGIQIAKFNHLVFIDDDVLVSPYFLMSYNKGWLKYPTAGIIGGRVDVEKENARAFTSDELRMLGSFSWCFGKCDWGNEDKKLKIGEMLFGANLSIRKKNLLKASFSDIMFDTSLGCHFYLDDYLRGEDLELCTRYMLENEEVVFVSDSGLTVINMVSEQRFTEEYVLKRHYISGIELRIIEKLLQHKHPAMKSFFFKVVAQGGLDQRFELLINKFKRTMLISWLSGKNYFQVLRSK